MKARQEMSSPMLHWASALKGYIEIARVDHWFKNVFMLFGVLFAYFHNPSLVSWNQLPVLVIAVLATCLITSSNYVLNEIRDATFDGVHPKKKFRPIPSGRVIISVAYLEWILLAVIGCVFAANVNVPFFCTTLSLWIMGIIYNVRPLRSKDKPYLDVLSESINNPIRLLLGWFAFVSTEIPSASLLIAYWMIGAFFMAAKRFAEYRTINNPEIARRYRESFKHYNETRLLVSMFFYVTFFALFCGIFIIKYHFELILVVPFIAGFISIYVKIAFEWQSAVQNPECLYRKKGFIIYTLICLFALIFLLLTDIPVLYEWFKVEPPMTKPLWTF